VNAESLQFLDDLYQLIVKDAIVKGTDRNTKVLEFLHPDQLQVNIATTISSPILTTALGWVDNTRRPNDLAVPRFIHALIYDTDIVWRYIINVCSS
jgi:hypothetical protein